MFACMDAPLQTYALLVSVSRTQLIISWADNRLLAGVGFSKLVQFQIHPPPPLYILTVPDWLSVKFHYSLIGPKVKILNTLIPRLTSDTANEFSANEDFFAVLRTRLTNMDSANECFSGCAR